MLKDYVPGLQGIVNFKMYDGEGNLTLDRTEKNLVVTAGLGFITDKTTGGATAIMSHMSVGTDGTAAAAANTLLGAETAKVALDSDNVVTESVTNDAIEFVATFAAGVGTGALQEAGLFNNATANTGDMLARTVYTTINKGASDSLVITWRIILAAV